VPQTVAILLIFQTALAAIALFVLVDGPEWVRSRIRLIALWTVLIGGIVALSLAVPWALTERGVTAWALVGLPGCCMPVRLGSSRRVICGSDTPFPSCNDTISAVRPKMSGSCSTVR
jgi:hypothetical protein